MQQVRPRLPRCTCGCRVMWNTGRFEAACSSGRESPGGVNRVRHRAPLLSRASLSDLERSRCAAFNFELSLPSLGDALKSRRLGRRESESANMLFQYKPEQSASQLASSTPVLMCCLMSTEHFSSKVFIQR